MNIFGFFAILIVCVALVTTVYIICDKGILIRKTSEDVTKRPEIPQNSEKKEDKPEEHKIAPMSLDAVIQAANSLMGVEIVEKETK